MSTTYAPEHTPRIASTNANTLLARTARYVVKSSLFSEVLAQTIRKEALRHSPKQATIWVLAMFDARCVIGTGVNGGIEHFANRVQAEVLQAGASRQALSEAVRRVVCSTFGQQLNVTGWLPGMRIVESKELVVLTGDGCPECVINPAVRETDGTIACLNSSECGWVK